MSPTKRTTTAKRAKPTAPPPWTADIRDLNLVAYNVSDLERAKKFWLMWVER